MPCCSYRSSLRAALSFGTSLTFLLVFRRIRVNFKLVSCVQSQRTRNFEFHVQKLSISRFSLFHYFPLSSRVGKSRF